MTDYRSMSGGEFRAAVGCDPEKWAEAFVQTAMDGLLGEEAWRQCMVSWFRDAMEAARVDERRHRINE